MSRAEIASWDGLDPRQRRQRTLDALKQLLIRESQVQPLLVVFEDLHWIDSETQALLDGLVESLPAARLLLLVNYRPEYQHQWGSRTYYTQLRLDPLPPETAEELLGALLGPDAGLEPLKRMLIARTEGNPFFLEESVRALVETGALAGERGAYRLARPLPAIEVPATVQAVLAARIDRLAPGDKALLQTASVVGKDVPFALLQAVAELAEDELRAAIGRLQAAEFLYETAPLPGSRVHVQARPHPRGGLREPAPGSPARPPRADRRRPSSASTRSARRSRSSGSPITPSGPSDVEAGAPLPRQAGAKAEARSAIQEAVVCLRAGADGAGTPSRESRHARGQPSTLRLDLRDALFRLAQFDSQLEHLREAERLAEAIADRRRLGRVLMSMCHYFTMTGDQDRAIDAGQRARALGAALGDRSVEARARHNLAQAYHALGDYPRALDLLRGALALEDELVGRGVVSIPTINRVSCPKLARLEFG